MNKRSATIGAVTLEVILNVLISLLLTAIVLPSFIKDNILLLLILLGTCVVAYICVQLVRKQLERKQLEANIGLVTLAVVLNVFINLLQNVIVLPSFIKASLLLLVFLGTCVVASIYVQFVEEQLKSPGPVGPPQPQPPRPYLTVVILGVFLSLVNVLSMDLIPIVVGVDPSPTPLQVLPCLVLSLIAGGTLARRSAVLPASLLAGLLIGLSGDTFIVIKYGPFLPYFPSYAWALMTTEPVTCLLLAWLAARTWIRSHGSLPVPTIFGQNRRRRSPAVTIFLMLLALIVLGGFSFDIYHNVTRAHSGTIGNLSDVVWSGSQFVAVGGIGVDRAKGTILTSADGRTWTPQPSDTSPYRFYEGVAWSGTQFVVVGDYGILTSADGHTWTRQPSGTSQWLQSVVWSGSQFVAVGSEGTILTSVNGRTWTPQASGTSQWLRGVIWSGSQFIVVGDGGVILTSPDGRTWT